MMTLQIRIPPKEKIVELCGRHHIRKMSFFGSVIREDFTKDSDIDIIVEFGSSKTPGLFTLIVIQNEFSDLLGRHIDIRTPNNLSRYFRKEVLETAEGQYSE